MSESRSKNVVRNISFALVNKIVAILLPFISRTIILYLLGKEYLGIGSLFTSILGFLSLAELGVGTAITHALYKPIEEKDTETVCKYLSFYRKIYRFIGMGMLILGIILTPFISYFINGEYPQDTNIYFLFLLYLLNAVISYFFAGYKQSLLIAHQREDIKSKITMFVNILIQVGQIVVLLVTKNFYVYAFVPILGTILTNIVNAYIVRKKYPEYVCRGMISKSERKNFKLGMSGLIGSKVNSVVINAADMVVISSFLGLVETMKYGNYYYLANAVKSFILLFSTSMIASVGNSLITEPLEKNVKLFKKIDFVNSWIVGWCSVCFICLYHPFMLIWVGKELAYSFHVEILIVICFYLYCIQRPMFLFKDAAGIWHADRFRPIVCMSINVILDLVLVYFIGIEGVVIASVIAYAVSVPWVNRTLFRNLFQNSAVKNILTMLYYFGVTVLASALTYGVCGFFTYKEDRLSLLLCLMCRTMVCIVVPNIIFLLAYFHKPEFGESLKMIKKIVAKLRK